MLTTAMFAREAAKQGRAIASHARMRDAQRTAIKRDPMVPPQNLPTLLRQFDAETKRQRGDLVAAFWPHKDEFVKDNVKPAPDLRPHGAAEAASLAAEMSIAPHLGPRQLEAQIRTATANRDYAKLALYLPLAEAYFDYKKPFAIGGISNVIIDARATLDAHPAVVASREAETFADAAESEFRLLDNILSGDLPIEQLDTYLRTGALPITLAGESPVMNAGQ